MDKPLRSILIIEDDPYVRRFYQRLFTLYDYHIDIAEDGPTGLAKAKENKPRLILLDILMPKMSGLDVLKALKADPETKNIEVIMLTNVSSDETIKAAASLGAGGFLIKSNTSEQELLAEINKHLLPT
ncbi:hypothetical protein A2634_02660 [Candidatus Amesbacteria bacterium RIFCSPHIGHO2_01_FULL_48_32]|uniref:Response regulatory domain-containing protein n=1 Tax=Candidatus Amesbacteria bacterium RIFCSPLOWO2_01_FULL_48_25 TaxID=1797259 RepID=A0A1F4ZD65_9BACT|nr:MAG: hypothetical protein A2634_02660 [Candidatus Amesbacteria bacterium RIFCSPHIGHO2_01_FULL_48_32]OGD04213.1 MAG: hypothetical protein A2989_01915 [Candidatus Amesbacteria bacterium RIFCSPLOWO2_01_FULL_48_25]